ncbi:DUF2812 domain-containing protein [Paenibacillus thalictri]|uniref:DUF2812 domain-containing protein n=1 Tax=Paenibacillus thalictri TaxID=2527873 RepID=A0A4Q9DQ47_9BACL|nr:DUF2812 domain-containing protein [Paenibacillus thalictri]TBL78528.1 DUF2812 domain-containing protein [Paenibacillus thalictri]
MRVFKFFVDFEKEEKWLTDMAKQGYQFTNKSIGYEFQAAEPENAIIKIDYRTFNKKGDFEDYRALFEDCGWEHISGTKNSGVQYFKKVDENGSEHIFSDASSKASRYKKISQMWISLATCFIPIFAVLISTGSIDVKALLNPKLLYYTPGLWDLTGAAFWRAFSFETPFAFFRGFIWVIIPLMIVLYLTFAYKANKHYVNTKEDKHE